MQTLKNALDFIDQVSPNVIICLIIAAFIFTVIHATVRIRKRDSKKQLIRSAHHNARIQRESIGRRVKK